MLTSISLGLNLRRSLNALGVSIVLAGLAVPASAATFEFTYAGTLHAVDSLTTGAGPDLLPTDSAFTFQALFDTGTPNLVAPLPNPGPGRGFVAYAPSQASFTISGVQYWLTGLGAPAGPSIAIFDKTNIFTPGRYGIGLIVNALADGGGFVGDFLSASQEFTVGALTSTTFQEFAGVGFSPGIGCGPDPAPCTFQPIMLTSGGQSYALQFGGTLGAADGGISYNGEPTTAILRAVPEPATWGTMMLGFGAMGFVSRRGRKATATPSTS